MHSLPCTPRQLVRLIFAIFATLNPAPGPAATPADAPPALAIRSPAEYQVFQHESTRRGRVLIRVAEAEGADHLEARLVVAHGRESGITRWQRLRHDPRDRTFTGTLSVRPGGWYRCEVRARRGGVTLATRVIEHVGVGEVFLVAGQSNSSNHGTPRQQPQSDLVVAFDGREWRRADDPQPGASGGGGSFVPAFGDALSARLGVPIGVVSIGVGGTSVREWLPRGDRMTNQPTTGAHVRAVGPHAWEATGELFERFESRLQALGPHGCRAVLWHQGESDAGQARSGYPADRQITGEQYLRFMTRLIAASRERAGWRVPWFTARATYHSEADPADAEFRDAQAEVWRRGLALEGPDTDALRTGYRDGVHFNGTGLRRHGELWAERVGDWLAGRSTSR